MTQLGFQHATPAFRTFCGDGALQALPRELDRAGARRVVLVCSPSLRRHHAPELARIQEILDDRVAGLFDGVEQHSPVPSVVAASQALAEANADGVLAIGGGSAVVTARAATILHAEAGELHELCTRRDDEGHLVSPRLGAAKIPQWVVPTTPTTAYAKAGAAVRDPETGKRLALFDPKARARAVFIDPGFAATAPFSVVRSAALNGFSMAIESLQTRSEDPLAEALTLQAVQMFAQSFSDLAFRPEDEQVRIRLMLASLLAGQGSDFASGGLAQVLSHAAGPRSMVSNGVVEALFLPHVMRFNTPVAVRGLAVAAQALGRVATPEAAIAAVESILRRFEVPGGLHEAGLPRDAIDDVITHAANDWALTRTPRHASPDDLRALIDAAW